MEEFIRTQVNVMELCFVNISKGININNQIKHVKQRIIRTRFRVNKR